MHIERSFYQDKKELCLDTAGILREFEAQQEIQLSDNEVQAGLRALENALNLEREHPKVENPERRCEFDELAQAALEMAELYGIDICVKIDRQMVGHIILCTDTLLLRREYAFDFLPLIKRLMDLCDEFLATPCEKDGEMLVCLSFDVPLYDRA